MRDVPLEVNSANLELRGDMARFFACLIAKQESPNNEPVDIESRFSENSNSSAMASLLRKGHRAESRQ
jgi:hypothetical protein